MEPWVPVPGPGRGRLHVATVWKHSSQYYSSCLRQLSFLSPSLASCPFLALSLGDAGGIKQFPYSTHTATQSDTQERPRAGSGYFQHTGRKEVTDLTIVIIIVLIVIVIPEA